MSKLPLIVKINFLILALFLIVYAIFNLRNNGIGSNLSSVFGFESSPSSAFFDWCDKPIKEIQFVEADITISGAPLISKWQSQFCKIPVTWDESIDGKNHTEGLILRFENEHPTVVMTLSKDGAYSWNNKGFRSKKLQEALLALKNQSL